VVESELHEQTLILLDCYSFFSVVCSVVCAYNQSNHIRDKPAFCLWKI